MMLKKYGIQVACITYFGNWRVRMDDWKRRGYVAILRDGYVSIHNAR